MIISENVIKPQNQNKVNFVEPEVTPSRIVLQLNGTNDLMPY